MEIGISTFLGEVESVLTHCKNFSITQQVTCSWAADACDVLVYVSHVLLSQPMLFFLETAYVCI